MFTGRSHAKGRDEAFAFESFNFLFVFAVNELMIGNRGLGLALGLEDRVLMALKHC